MKRIVGIVVLVMAAGAGATLLRPALRAASCVYSLSAERPPAQLPNPVRLARAPRLMDSWGAPRSGGRRHEGIDIFASRDTPVVSTTRGLVMFVGTNGLGGQIVGVLGPGLEWHYYAHLDRFGTFEPGDVVNAGDVLGYVGNTGNARGTPSHLHYGIYIHGTAENPYPRLARPHRRS